MSENALSMKRSEIIEPISNLFLRFNRYGHLLLSREKRLSSNFVAASLLLGLTGLLLYFGLSDERWLGVAVFGVTMMIPLGSMFDPTSNRKLLLGYTIALGVFGLLGIWIAFTGGAVFNLFTTLYLLGLFGYQWVANYVLIREGNG